MPQRIVIVYSCSFCLKEYPEDREAISTYTLAGPGLKVAFDVCRDCRAGHVTVTTFLESGYTPKGAPKATKAPAPALPGVHVKKQHPCGECSHVAANPQGLGAHRRDEHGWKRGRPPEDTP